MSQPPEGTSGTIHRRGARGRRWRTLLSLIALLAFGYVVLQQGPARLWKMLRALPPTALLLAWVLYASGQAFNALRWYFLLRGRGFPVRYGDLVRVYWAGNLSGILISSYLGGDGYRAMAAYGLLARKEPAITSVMLDRLTNLAAMAMLLPWSLWVLGPRVLQVVGGIGYGLPLAVGVLPAFGRGLQQAWEAWRRHPRGLLWAFLAAWPSNLAPMLGTFVVARALGIPVGYGDVIAAQTATYWLSLGGWAGVREMGYLAVYGLLGADPAQAALLALVTRGLQWAVAVPGGLWLGRYLPTLPLAVFREQGE